MLVEDAINDLALRVHNASDLLGEVLRRDDWTRKFILDLNRQISEQRPLSTQQSKYFLKVVERYRETMIINEIGWSESEIDRLLTFPRHRREPYQSTFVKNEVRYLGDNKLGFRFKVARRTLEAIKALRQKDHPMPWADDTAPRFDGQHKLWVVPITSGNINRVMGIILNYEFNMDPDVVAYLELCEQSKNQPSTFVLDPESGDIIANVCDDNTLAAWTRSVAGGELL